MLRFWTLAVCLLTAPALAATVLAESLEWVVADSDLVVVGTLADVDRVRDKSQVIWSTVTVKVKETLKGEKKEEWKFLASHKSRFASDRLVELAGSKAEVIVCLVKGERYKAIAADYAAANWALRLGTGELDQAVLDLSDKSASIGVAMNGRLLSGRDDLLKAARSAGALAPKAVPQGRLRVPAPLEAVKKLAEGGPLWLFVPVDARLEGQAREWLKSKDIELREEGAKALRHFKSEDNVALLKGLLEDPGLRTDGTSKTFPVRKAAYGVLKEWGIEVKPPVTDGY